MHAITPYLIKSFEGTDKEKKESKYFNLSDVRGKDLLILLHEYMKSKSAHVYDFSEEKRVFKFSDISFDSKKRTVSAFLVAGFYGFKSDIIDISSGAIRFPKSESDAEVLRHFVQFTVPPGSSEAIGLFHKSRGIGIKSLFDKLFKAHFRSETQSSLQITPYAHTEAVRECAKGARVKKIQVKGFVPSTDIAANLNKLGECNTEFFITPKMKKKGIRSSFGLLSDFLTPEANSVQNQVVTLLSSQGASVRTVAELNGATRTFEVGANSEGVACDIPFAEDTDNVELEGGQPTFLSTKTWAEILTNDILKGVYGRRAFQL
jgi:hypothetical protein